MRGAGVMREAPGEPPGTLDLLPIAVLVLDGRLTVTAVNRRAGEIAGVCPGELIGRRIHDTGLAASWDRPLAPVIGMAVRTGARSRTVLTQRTTGSRFQVTVTPSAGGNGAAARLVVALDEAAGQAEEVSRLESRVEFVEGLLDHLPAAVLVLDRGTGVVVSANTALSALTGVPAAELVGTRPPLFFADGWDPVDVGPEARPVTIRRRDGAAREVSARAADGPDTRGRRVRVVMMSEACPGAADGERSPAAAEGLVALLTPRRREVLRLLCEGLETTVIARRLVISEHTARNHVQAVLRTLGCRSRVAAVAIAFQAGLCGPGAGR